MLIHLFPRIRAGSPSQSSDKNHNAPYQRKIIESTNISLDSFQLYTHHIAAFKSIIYLAHVSPSRSPFVCMISTNGASLTRMAS